ncbi:response regulator [Staphylococcus hominis]|uniref:ANTAR domain-containing response regulator n=1 Tax=Staphylococcus hominis TaxID=1290 RepID=UPI0015F7DD87|nr:response regulator [Staphylococcus hominis]MDT4035925.1 response regulator [Staphylococcus hominis]
MTSIIVVEDESIVRLDIVEMLKDANYDVVAEASNGEKALELINKFKPDLVIMDIKMPKLDGLKASKIISKKYETPILILTAYSHSDYVENAKQDNIIGYIVKPISEAQLLPAVEVAISQSNNLKKLKREIINTKKQINNRKLIEKAKGILMDHLNLSEEAAYQKLRRTSMNKQITIEKEATAIIEALG